VLGVIIDPPGPEWRASLASVAKEGQRDGVRRRLGASIVEWTWSRLSELADRRADELVRATEAPDEGVTLLLVFHHPPGMQALRRLLRGLPPAGDGDRWPPREAPAATVQIWAGHRPE
jgi:hypothetical protein